MSTFFISAKYTGLTPSAVSLATMLLRMTSSSQFRQDALDGHGRRLRRCYRDLPAELGTLLDLIMQDLTMLVSQLLHVLGPSPRAHPSSSCTQALAHFLGYCLFLQIRNALLVFLLSSSRFKKILHFRSFLSSFLLFFAAHPSLIFFGCTTGT